MTDVAASTDQAKRFRSPPYPAINLGKAIERAKLLYDKALHHAVGVSVLADAWGYKVKSSGLWGTAAALMQFGLLTDEGTGEKRRFQLTDWALRIIRDPNPISEKRKATIQQAALYPKIFKELWESYQGATTISDIVLKSHLTIDRHENGLAPYSDAAADEVIAVYKETLVFAGFNGGANSVILEETSDKKGGQNGDHTPSGEKKHLPKVGEYVQWTSNGADQFKNARKVEWVSEDGAHIGVFGSPTGIPMNETTVVQPPKPALKMAETTPLRDEQRASEAADISVLQVGNRLQITADVDDAGLVKLQELLKKYEEILKLLQ